MYNDKEVRQRPLEFVDQTRPTSFLHANINMHDSLRDISPLDGLGLRVANPQHQPLLEALFRSTREFLYQLPLPRAQLDLLVAQQYQLQQASYRQQWPQAQTLVVERAGVAIGKITLDETETTLHVVDFVLDPSMRGQGYGTAILRALQSAAGQRRIRLSVDRQNPAAKKLYYSLGFQVDAATDSHESMSWSLQG